MNYYNENDPKMAAWLRELIKGGHISNGEVDERSIKEVRADELAGFRQCHFFAGIGGWSLALRLAGISDDQPLWTGSCPCQPFSTAGKQMGRSDPRHLWPTWRRLINRGRPLEVHGEQVASAAGRIWLSGVRADLETMGYAPRGIDLCSASVGAPTIRQRLYWSGRLEQPSRFGGPSGLSGQVAWEEGKPGVSNDSGHAAFADGGGGGGARTCRVGHSELSRLEGHSWHELHGNKSGRLSEEEMRSVAEASSLGHWADFDLLLCKDGKARRIESGTFPLANGISHRVGLLWGYGNAINPFLAAQYLKAVS